jgi:hypothetical protein
MPFKAPLPAIMAAHADAAVAARMQVGISALASTASELLDCVQAHVARAQADADEDAVRSHLVAAFRTIKRELLEGMDRFGQCRDELLLLLREPPLRATALHAMQEVFGRVEEWYCRLEDLARFCEPPRSAASTPDSASAASPPPASQPPPPPPAGSPAGECSTPRPAPGASRLVALLSPQEERVCGELGVRVRQWREGGRHLLKLENIGDKRIRLDQALFSMSELAGGGARVGGAGRWVDTMEVGRVLTPVNERRRNIGAECDPAFICFAFAPCDGDGEPDEEEVLTPQKRRREQERSAVTRAGAERGLVSPPGDNGKRKRAGGQHAMSATFKLRVLP